MPRLPPRLPTGETLADEFARELVLLLGWVAPDESNHADDARVLGAGSAAAHEQLTSAVLEAFTTRTTQLLDAWEDALATVSTTGASETSRRAALTALRRAGGANSRGPFAAALRAIDPTATFATGSVLENALYRRGVFVFSVRVSPEVLADPARRAQVIDVLERMKPAHTTYRLTSNEGFFTNDPASLTDTSGDVLRV